MVQNQPDQRGKDLASRLLTFQPDSSVLRHHSLYGEGVDRYNPNGSIRHIAGIHNETRTVLGMMPHPENAIRADQGSTDGWGLFAGMAATFGQPVPWGSWRKVTRENARPKPGACRGSFNHRPVRSLRDAWPTPSFFARAPRRASVRLLLPDDPAVFVELMARLVYPRAALAAPRVCIDRAALSPRARPIWGPASDWARRANSSGSR